MRHGPNFMAHEFYRLFVEADIRFIVLDFSNDLQVSGQLYL